MEQMKKINKTSLFYLSFNFEKISILNLTNTLLKYLNKFYITKIVSVN